METFITASDLVESSPSAFILFYTIPVAVKAEEFSVHVGKCHGSSVNRSCPFVPICTWGQMAQQISQEEVGTEKHETYE